MQTQQSKSTAVKWNRLSCIFFSFISVVAGWGIVTAAAWSQEPGPAEAKIRVLIVDGQNNHAVWPKTSEMMRKYLLDSGLFSVDLARTAPQAADPNFKPDFSQYQLVVSNYNGEAWPEETQKAFETFMANGGGLVVVHAADNSFPNWPAWNEMIGLGGWGGRDARSGPYVYFDEAGQPVRSFADGGGGSHGAQHEFLIAARDQEHPIMRGLPAKWLHAQDELYDRLRGPAENMRVLATAFAAKEQGGSGRHEPQLMVVEYKQGRVFHTTLGHADYSQECVGFITVFLRGAEWAATGKVTQAVPEDFPTADKVSRRKYEQ